MKNRIAAILMHLGVSANFLTALGLGVALTSAIFIGMDHFFLAGCLLLLSGILDLLDGAVARQSGKADAFGGILDSSLDRYGDGFIFGAILIFFMSRGAVGLAVASLMALLGSFSISYIRARAECEIDSCRVGFWERGERLVFLSLALILNNIPTAIIILCLGVQWSAFQRLRHAFVMTQTHANPSQAPKSHNRQSTIYYTKLAILIIAILFLKMPHPFHYPQFPTLDKPTKIAIIR